LLEIVLDKQFSAEARRLFNPHPSPQGHTPVSTLAHVTAQIGLQAAQLERTSVYLRDLCDIVTRTQTEVFKVGTLGAEEAAKLAKAELDELISAWPVANLKFLDVRGLVAR